MFAFNFVEDMAPRPTFAALRKSSAKKLNPDVTVVDPTLPPLCTGCWDAMRGPEDCNHDVSCFIPNWGSALTSAPSPPKITNLGTTLLEQEAERQKHDEGKYLDIFTS